MKIQLEGKKFEPIKLSLTIESQEEANVLHFIGNAAPNSIMELLNKSKNSSAKNDGFFFTATDVKFLKEFYAAFKYEQP